MTDFLPSFQPQTCIRLLADSDNFPSSVHEWTAADGATTALDSRRFHIPAYSMRDGGWISFVITGYYTQTASTSMQVSLSINGNVGPWCVLTTAAAATTAGPFIIRGVWAPVSDAESGTFCQFLDASFSMVSGTGTALTPNGAGAVGSIGFLSIVMDPNVDNYLTLRVRKSATAGSVIDSIRSWTAYLFPGPTVLQ